MHQTELPDEIVVADDGSTDDTKDVIATFSKGFKGMVKHIWQPNKGYRRSRILNKAIMATDSEYVVTVDNDVLLHPKFVADHKAHALVGHFVSGGRCHIKEEYAVSIKEGVIDAIPGFLSSGLGRRFRSVRLPFLSRLLYWRHRHSTRQLCGSNLGFWKSDFIKVNGFEEEFVGWGSEDREFCLRLMNIGVRRRSVEFGIVQYHLDHPVRKVEETANINHERFLATKFSNKITATLGIDQYNTNDECQ